MRSFTRIYINNFEFLCPFSQVDEKPELFPSESEGKEQQLEESEKKEEEEKDAAISEIHPTATDLQTVTTRETAQTHDSVIPEKESKEEDATTAVGNEPNTASEATTQDDPPHGELAVSAVQAIAAPLAAETGSRITTSPPCEVSSTTSSQGPEETAPLPLAPPAADDDKKVHGTTAAPRLVEGVIADSNNEKVLFEEEEDDEIDDVEPAVSAPETLETAAAVAAAASSQVFQTDPLEASGAPNSGENERVLDPPQIVSSDPRPDPVPEVDHLASDAASPVEGGSLEAAALVNSDLISISVVDRTAVPAADRATEVGGEGEAAEQKQLRKHHATASDEVVEDVSVTMVERKKRRPSSSPDRTTDKRRREEEDVAVMIDSRLMRVEADATAVTDHRHHPEPIVTISKVSAVKAAAAPAASPGPTDATARRTPVSSPSAVQQINPLQPPAAGTSYSMFAQRMRGGGAQHPPRPGGLMMLGHHPPPRGFLMRGGFRGGPRGAGSLPSLQPRPPLGGPMSLPPAGGFPSAAAGPVAEQLNRVAGRLADYMKHSLEDLFRDLSSQVGLQLQLDNAFLIDIQCCGSGIRCLFDLGDRDG